MREVTIEIPSTNPAMAYTHLADLNIKPYATTHSDGSASYGRVYDHHNDKWKFVIILPESHPFYNITIFGGSHIKLYVEIVKRGSLVPIIQAMKDKYK